jgi:hypothetical protein
MMLDPCNIVFDSKGANTDECQAFAEKSVSHYTKNIYPPLFLSLKFDFYSLLQWFLIGILRHGCGNHTIL